MKIDFLIGGTEPAGTNQLFFLLGRHRDVCLPIDPQPEPNFFSKQIEHRKGVDYYHRRYFEHYAGQTRVGEKSGRYLWHPKAAERIHAYNPRMKIIFILRDPVDRAWSNYRFNCLNGIEPLGFKAALDAEPQRCESMARDAIWKDVQPYAYFEKGLYVRQLQRYLERFDRNCIYVLHNEALRADPFAEAARVLGFLGLSAEAYTPIEACPQYPSYHVRSRRLQALIRRVSRPLLEHAIMKRRSGGKPTAAERLVQMNFTDRRTWPAPAVTDVLRRRYREEMRELRALTGLKITQWDEPAATAPAASAGAARACQPFVCRGVPA